MLSRVRSPAKAGAWWCSGQWTTTTGIWADAKYLTDCRYSAELRSKLAGTGGDLPRHYQAVLRLQVRDAVPLTIAYLAHRVL